MDVSLLQTSLLDGWDYTQPLTYEERDNFRRFLEDAHKAACVPICIAGGQTKILTSEPAVTVPFEGEVDVFISSCCSRASFYRMKRTNSITHELHCTCFNSKSQTSIKSPSTQSLTSWNKPTPWSK